MAARNSESIKRSIVKSFSWRMVIIVSDLVVIYALTHRFDLAVSVMVATNLASIVLYYVHERVWNRVSWGRKK